ncbi:MAG: hypothetical protein HKP30_13175, partial [Myxococcales bacterium]|nr:hypothetical protein [Myxococcales bacterium]
VRSGILASIERDVERRGGRTAGLLATAALFGVVGAIGATMLVASHPFDHHPAWHVGVFSTVWAGLLFVCLSLVFLQVRTPSLPLARSASAGLLGLGLAGICGALCPDQHFLAWWTRTGLGEPLTRAGGLALSAACFGLVTALLVAFVSALAMFAGRAPVRPALPATILLVLLAPGVALQSVGASLGVLAGWLAGTAAGSYLGVIAGLRIGAILGRR